MISEKVTTVKGLVKDLRVIRDKMNAELENLTSEQRKEFFRELRAKSDLRQQVPK